MLKESKIFDNTRNLEGVYSTLISQIKKLKQCMLEWII